MSSNNGPGRAEVTRQRILRTAERLFAQHGVSGVSLNTINQVARQKNKNAVHYHFGGKTGLLQAIFDKHSPAITERRRQRLAALEGQQPTLRRLLQALVLPVAEQAENRDGGEYYIHISAELIATNTLSFYEPANRPLRINREDQLAQMIAVQLDLPPALLEARMLLVTGLMFHGLSDHLRLRSAASTDEHPALTDTAMFVSNLVDSLEAVLMAQPSGETLTLLK